MQNIGVINFIESLESGSRPKGGSISDINGIPSFGGEHILRDGTIKNYNLKYIPQHYFEQLNQGKIQKNDILIVKDGATTGKTAYVDNNFLFNNAAVNEHVFILRTKNEFLISKYLFFWLITESGNKQILSDFRGAAQGGISRNFINYINFRIPPLSEQKKIVEILEQADELRKKKKEAIEKSEKIITALFYKMFGDPVKNERNWKVETLKNVIELNYGNSLPNGKRMVGKYPVYGSNGIVGFHDNYLIDYPTIVIGRKGSAGSVTLIHEPSFPIDTTFYTNIKKDLNIDFLFQYLKIFDLKKLSIITGVPGVNRDDIYKQKIIVPPIDVQNKFSQLTKLIRAILNDIQNTSKVVNNLFENILYKAFSGELTIIWREKNKEKLLREIEERKLKYGF